MGTCVTLSYLESVDGVEHPYQLKPQRLWQLGIEVGEFVRLHESHQQGVTQGS